MILEVATIQLKSGTGTEFETAFHAVKHAVLSSPGLLSLRMTRGIESPDTYILLVEWESVEAHEKNFRETDRFATWRAGIGPFFAAPPHVEHFSDIEEAPN